MKTVIRPVESEWDSLLQRPTRENDSVIQGQVQEILTAVKEDQDAALRRFSTQFDGVTVDSFAVSRDEMKKAREVMAPELLSAINEARQNISTFHSAQQREDISIETTAGITCSRRAVPIERVGLYVPGGTAPLFSTLLMLAVPAQLAGCRERVLVSPPPIHPTILTVADLLEIEEVYQVGGAQAIAALAFGTETIRPVNKIFGPGNQYVTAAKQLVAIDGTVAVDLPAGPSELLIVADAEADPEFVAADLLSQAEHGKDSQVVLVTTSELFAQQVFQAVASQIELLPRKEIAQGALENSLVVVVDTLETAIALSNRYAPEHLILAVADSERWESQITNAGSVFLGYLTPESFGDYAAGTNHTLPTGGAARAYSGVSLDSFQKQITFQRATEEGLRNLGPAVAAMAAAEELEAHRKAVTIRTERSR